MLPCEGAILKFTTHHECQDTSSENIKVLISLLTLKCHQILFLAISSKYIISSPRDGALQFKARKLGLEKAANGKEEDLMAFIGKQRY